MNIRRSTNREGQRRRDCNFGVAGVRTIRDWLQHATATKSQEKNAKLFDNEVKQPHVVQNLGSLISSSFRETWKSTRCIEGRQNLPTAVLVTPNQVGGRRELCEWEH